MLQDILSTLCKPRHVDVSDDRAYVVVPATMMFKVHGKQVTQSSSSATIGRALRPAMSFGYFGARSMHDI